MSVICEAFDLDDICIAHSLQRLLNISYFYLTSCLLLDFYVYFVLIYRFEKTKGRYLINLR